MPGRFLRDLDTYRDERALVFDGIRNNQVRFWLLMSGNYDRIADSLVQLEGDDRTRDELVAMLKERVQRQIEPVRGLWDTRWDPETWEAPRRARRAATR